MTRGEIGILPPAGQTDAAAAIARFLGQHGEEWRLQSHEDFEKTLLSRLLDAAGPVCLKAAREIRRTGPFEAGGIAFAPCAAPNPWVAAFKAVPPQGKGIIFGVTLDVPMNESATFRAMVAAKSASRPKTDSARDDIASSIIDEIRLEEEIARSLGYPADLPDPDTVSRIDQFGIYEFGVARKPAGAGPGHLLASLRDATEKDEEAVLRSIGPQGFAPTRIAEARPSNGYGMREGFSASRIDGYQPLAWHRACEALRIVLANLGLADDMAASAREVAARPYECLADREWDIALTEAGAACAAMDGGLPGDRAAKVQALLESGCASLRIGEIAARALHLARSAIALGATGPDTKADFNDLDNAVWAKAADNVTEMDLKDQNGTLAVIIAAEGDRVTAITAARYGLPLEDYLSSGYGDEDLLSAGVASYKEAHRDYANPHDPLAPLERDAATAALREGLGGFPGFLGSYEETAPGTWSAKIPMTLDLRSIKDLNLLDSCAEAGAIEIGELADTARRADVAALLQKMAETGDGIASQGAGLELVSTDGTRRPAPDGAEALIRCDLTQRGAGGIHRISAMGRASIGGGGAQNSAMAESAA